MRLSPGLPFYQDKLHEETVYKYFKEILNKVRREAAALVDVD